MDDSVQSDVGRKNEGRQKVTYTLDPKTLELLEAYAQQTGAPAGRTIDRAVASYLSDKLNPSPAKPQGEEE